MYGIYVVQSLSCRVLVMLYPSKVTSIFKSIKPSPNCTPSNSYLFAPSSLSAYLQRSYVYKAVYIMRFIYQIIAVKIDHF